MKPQDRSLAYHLLFPLLRLPKTSLGSPENLLNVYLHATSPYTLVVEVQDRTQLWPAILSSPKLQHDYFCGESQWLLFSLSEFTQECELFREGKYSQFSDPAKLLFRTQWAQNYGALLLSVEESLLYWSLTKDTTNATTYWVQRLDIHPSILPSDLYYLPQEEDFITL